MNRIKRNGMSQVWNGLSKEWNGMSHPYPLINRFSFYGSFLLSR